MSKLLQRLFLIWSRGRNACFDAESKRFGEQVSVENAVELLRER